MVNLAIISGQTMLREGYGSLISMNENLHLLFDAKNGIELLEKLKIGDKKPDVILMDVSMPLMGGIDATEIVHADYPNIKCLLMSEIEHEYLVAEVFHAGAFGFVGKSVTFDMLLRGIYMAMDGLYFICCAQLVDSREGFLIIPDIKPLVKNGLIFSNKQKNFMRLCATSLSYKEIAIKMNISPKTVDRYRENMFSLLNINCRVGLALYAISAGIVVIPGVD